MLIRMLKQNFSYLEIKTTHKKNKRNHSFKLSGPRRRKSKNTKIYSTGIPLFLHFTDILCFFYKLKVDGTICWTRLLTFFPTAFAHFMSLCHILVVILLLMFQIFYGNVCYGDQSSVILDITVVVVLGTPKAPT